MGRHFLAIYVKVGGGGVPPNSVMLFLAELFSVQGAGPPNFANKRYFWSKNSICCPFWGQGPGLQITTIGFLTKDVKELLAVINALH